MLIIILNKYVDLKNETKRDMRIIPYLVGKKNLKIIKIFISQNPILFSFFFILHVLLTHKHSSQGLDYGEIRISYILVRSTNVTNINRYY